MRNIFKILIYVAQFLPIIFASFYMNKRIAFTHILKDSKSAYKLKKKKFEDFTRHIIMMGKMFQDVVKYFKALQSAMCVFGCVTVSPSVYLYVQYRSAGRMC